MCMCFQFYLIAKNLTLILVSVTVTKSNILLLITQKANTQEMIIDWKGIWSLLLGQPPGEKVDACPKARFMVSV